LPSKIDIHHVAI